MSDGKQREVVGSRGPELGVAAFLILLGGLVIADSLRVGAGWADDGPRAGYFPFYIGCALVAASGWIFAKQLWRWRSENGAFAEREQIDQVVAVLVPMSVYVAAIFPLGIYVASTLLIVYFMRRFGKYGWLATLSVSIGVPLAFFLVFERWFLVALHKGPLERFFGF